MGQKGVLKEKLKVENSLLGINYISDFSVGFHYIELPKKCGEKCRVIDKNMIFFVVEGSCSISCNQYTNRKFFAGDMVFFPKSAMITYKVLEDSKILYMAFDVPYSICDRLFITNLYKKSEEVKYDFKALKANNAIDTFVTSVVYLLNNIGDNLEVNNIKHQEIFLILRLFYSEEELTNFFYPIIGMSFNFRNFVLENHHKCNKLIELIELSNLCPNAFMRKFKKEFGISGYQWMLKQLCKKIEHKASQPDVTIKEIMEATGVVDPANFTRLCKKNFGKTPTALIAMYQHNKSI